jgi:hypothetical protein
VTWKDKLEIGLKEDAPYRRDNLPASQVRGPEKGLGLARFLRFRWRAIRRTKPCRSRTLAGRNSRAVCKPARALPDRTVGADLSRPTDLPLGFLGGVLRLQPPKIGNRRETGEGAMGTLAVSLGRFPAASGEAADARL